MEGCLNRLLKWQVDLGTAGSNFPELKNSTQEVNWSYYRVKNSQRYKRTLKGNTSLRRKHQSFIAVLEGIIHKMKIPHSENPSKLQ